MPVALFAAGIFILTHIAASRTELSVFKCFHRYNYRFFPIEGKGFVIFIKNTNRNSHYLLLNAHQFHTTLSKHDREF